MTSTMSPFKNENLGNILENINHSSNEFYFCNFRATTGNKKLAELLGIFLREHTSQQIQNSS